MRAAMRKAFIRNLFALQLVLCLAAPAGAAEKLMGKPAGHYDISLNAVEGAVNPAPGSDILAVTFQAWDFVALRDKHGRKLPTPDISLLGNSWTWVHMFENGLFGGSTGFKASFTGGHIEAHGDLLPENQNSTRIGDPGIDFMQGWTLENAAIRFKLGVDTGLGDYRKEEVANYAKDFWSFHTQLGATWWFDQDRKYSATLLGTYETNTTMQHWAVRPGDSVALEAGLGYKVNEHLALALAGYAAWQVTPDSGNDMGWDNSGKYRIYGAGPQVRIMLPFIKPWGMLSLGYWREFGARDFPERNRFITELCIPF